MRIRDIVKAKDISGVVTIEPGATVRDLLNLLAEKNIGALVVSTDGQSVDGIVSERDVVRHIQRADKNALEERVEAIMTSTVHTCAPDADLDEVMGAMTERRIRHVPVVGPDGLTGLVSIGDVVKHKISVLQFERDQLDSYVHQT
jgi:CBS domain-containing protein